MVKLQQFFFFKVRNYYLCFNLNSESGLPQLNIRTPWYGGLDPLAVLIALYNMMRDKDKLRSVYDDLPLSTSTASYEREKR